MFGHNLSNIRSSTIYQLQAWLNIKLETKITLKTNDSILNQDIYTALLLIEK